MYYLINPLVWPFTIIPNLPIDLIEIIDSPLPLLIGMLGNTDLAEEINRDLRQFQSTICRKIRD